MNHIIFENSGEIEPLAITTFGCSVKESKNPIGYFGTGLKFALAVLLRENHKIVLQCGDRQVEIGVRSQMIRGKEFQLVFVGDKSAGFTTELGKNWKTWMAYRELHCNAKDEPDSRIYESAEVPAPIAGKTRLIVQGDLLETAHRTREDFILEGEPDFKLGTLEVFRRATSAFFYLGIKVMQFEQPCLYTYNQTAPVTLTEDRTVAEPESVRYDISRAILSHADPAVLEKVLLSENNRMEFYLDYHGWNGTTPSRDFFPTVARLQKSKLLKINNSALRLWREKGGGFISPRLINPTKVQIATLEKAIDFAVKSGFPLREEYPILIVESLGENGNMAAADLNGKQILLTERLFQESGTKGVARALIEEYIHLKFGLSDESREMQNFLFGKMISLAEELTGEPL